MYEPFFGLSEKPFNLTPDPRYFYLSESHREALAALIYGVREKAGLITLAGPVGVGKTMILASFLDQIEAHAETASFSGAVSGDRTEFLKDLCRVLGISSEQGSLFGLSQAIKDFAVKKTGEGRSVVVLVDEAQDLSLEELDHFHHLSNLETPDAKLLQIILAGTEKLDEKLKDKSLEALWQRVAIRCAIEPIESKETIEYIFHRMRVAGSSSIDLFTNGALWRIVNYARGVPRLINLVCNQAMIAAYSAGKVPVDEDAVLEALKEIEGSASAMPTEELVGRNEIRGLVEVVFRRLEEGEDGAGVERGEDSRKKREATEHEREVVRRSRRRSFTWFRLGRRKFALTLALVLLFPLAGVLLTIGLLKPRVTEVQRVVVASPDESGAGWGGDSPEMMALGVDAPKGGPEQTFREEENVEIVPEFLALGVPEGERVSGGSKGELERVAVQDSREWDSFKDQVLTREKKVTVRERDFAGVALEQYGRLDVEMLKLLREKNPQIRDWNSLDRAVQLVLPDMPQGTNGGANFYTIQVGAFRAEEGASRTASDLAKRGAQNLFLVKGEGKSLTLVCVGVFESGGQSSAAIRKMKEWGYDDAFPTLIQEKRLEDILRPYDGSGAGKSPIEERHALAEGFPPARE